MNHNELVDYFARVLKLKNNHRKRTTYSIERTVRNVIPDLVDGDTFYEIEITGNKDHYHDIISNKKILIVGIQSYDAFDEVQIYKVQDPIEMKVLGLQIEER